MNKRVLIILCLGFFSFIKSMEQAKEQTELKSQLSAAMQHALYGSQAVSKAINEAIKTHNVNLSFGEEKLTPLHLAVSKGTIDDIRSLLEHGANVNSKNAPAGSAPLHFAILSPYRARQGDLKRVIELLAKAGANLKEEDTKGNTALQMVRLQKQLVSRNPRLQKVYQQIDDLLVKQGVPMGSLVPSQGLPAGGSIVATVTSGWVEPLYSGIRLVGGNEDLYRLQESRKPDKEKLI